MTTIMQGSIWNMHLLVDQEKLHVFASGTNYEKYHLKLRLMEILIENSGRNDGYGECKHS